MLPVEAFVTQMALAAPLKSILSPLDTPYLPTCPPIALVDATTAVGSKSA